MSRVSLTRDTNDFIFFSTVAIIHRLLTRALELAEGVIGARGLWTYKSLAKTSSHWSGIRIQIGSWSCHSRDPFRVSVYIITGLPVQKYISIVSETQTTFGFFARF
jgi:hypothetical protein